MPLLLQIQVCAANRISQPCCPTCSIGKKNSDSSQMSRGSSLPCSRCQGGPITAFQQMSRGPSLPFSRCQGGAHHCLSADVKGPITAFQQTDNKRQFLLGCRFPAVERMGQDVLSVQRLTHGYQDRTLFKNCDFEMEKSERVALIGTAPFSVPFFHGIILHKAKSRNAQSETIWGEQACADLKHSHRTDHSYWQKPSLHSCCLCSRQIGRLHVQT